ncbi:hypothetical protein [Streptomyces sp. SID1121]|uniref:hypothetical protein n=1 Tax=Streptomyces sp. SID1121 TaxID=3425888 RepID=UPI004057360E
MPNTEEEGEPSAGARVSRHNWELARGPIDAFGESKTVAQWAKDPRCPVKPGTLRGRLALGWDPEDAITRRNKEEPPLRFTHFERSLTLHGWAEQSGVSAQSLYSRVFIDGMRFKDALLQGPDEPAYAIPLSAFGETKPVHRWALDPRTSCTAPTLLRRVQANWPPEQAITQPPERRTTPAAGTEPTSSAQHAVDHALIHISADQLKPGDHVVALGQDPSTGQPLLTVRRAIVPPSPADGGRPLPSPTAPPPGLPTGPGAQRNSAPHR